MRLMRVLRFARAPGVLFCLATIAPMTGTADSASDSGATLQEVIVTAQKKAESSLDVPVPVTSLDAGNLSATNQVGIQDYFTRIPSLDLTQSVEGGGPVVVIRGLDQLGGSTPVVAFSLDDVPVGGFSTFGLVPDIDPSDLKDIEILRGPQGTLYGAGAMGGLIRYVTKDPSTTEFSGHVQAGTSGVTGGDEAGFNVRGSVNVPVSDSSALRFSGFTREDPGFIDNVLTGQKGVDQNRSRGASFAGVWKPSDLFSVRLNAITQSTSYGNKLIGIQSTAYSGYGDPAVAALPQITTSQQFLVAGGDGSQERLDGYSLVVKGNVGNVALTSVTGYTVQTLYSKTDLTDFLGGFTYGYTLGLGNPVYGSPMNLLNYSRKFSEEIRADATLTQSADLLVGVFYSHENGLAQENLFAANSVTGDVIAPTFFYYNPQKYRTYAVFTDFTYKFTEKFDVQIGARENRDDQIFPGQTESGPIVGGSFTNSELKTSTDEFTYLLTPRFHFLPDVMGYIRVASGSRPGTINPPSPLTPDAPAHSDPDPSKDYELGLKGYFLDRTVSIDASLYRIDWKNIQIAVIEPATGSGYNTNAGDVRSQGVEFSLNGRPWRTFAVTANVWFDDAKLVSTPAHPSVYMNPGDRVPNTSRLGGLLSLEEDFPLTAGASGYVGATASYLGDRLGNFQGISATPTEQLPRQYYPAFAKFDLIGGIRFQHGLSTNIYVNNLADKRGELNGGADSLWPHELFVIPGRTFGVSVDYAF